jgi:3-oxo-4,17-pregnadiene-20-carboxyl-CoA hydratase alpha subunit
MTDLLTQLKTFEGREVGSAEMGPDPVNQPMIRHWVEAIGDDNPVYTDADAAVASVHGGIVAPPVMLQAWVMRGIRPRPAEGANPRDDLMRLLDDAGFTSVVATNCEQEYHRYVRPGDHLRTTTTVDSVSPEKQTALGAGHFVTTRVSYHDQHGELVGSMLFRILKFKPPEKDATYAAGAERPKRPRPAITQDNAFFFEGAREGKLLIQRCASCGRLRHPPRPMCSACRSLDWDTVEAAGRGVVYSFVVNHHPQVAAFDYPLVVALVELEEGTRLVSNIVGVDPHEVHVGMPVEVELVAFDDELTLPQFHPAPGAST